MSIHDVYFQSDMEYIGNILSNPLWMPINASMYEYSSNIIMHISRIETCTIYWMVKLNKLRYIIKFESIGMDNSIIIMRYVPVNIFGDFYSGTSVEIVHFD